MPQSMRHDQAKKWGGRGADKFINALLRSVQRDIQGPINQQDQYRIRATLWMDHQAGCQFKSDYLPDPTKNTAKYFSLAYSHPLWLIERWLNRYDQPKVRTICLAHNGRPPLTLRINSLQCNSLEYAEKLTEANIQSVIKDQAVQLIDRVSPDQLPGYNQGWFTVQDITAINAVKMLNPRPGDKVLDLCAAPGGKTTQIAESMNNTGRIVACDVTEEKLARITENYQRLGFTIVETCLNQDLPARTGEDLFDAVLVDAPCSNTGVMARRVEVRHRLKPIHLSRLVNLQADLLNKASKLIKNGGKLLYSTCSIEPVENDLLVRKFLQSNDSFELVSENFYFPETQKLIEKAHSTPKASNQKPHYQLWQDGGYAALLQRSSV
ncbi:MAG: methyltransferase domain-containing protein [Planctomycetes bacterium]|nr:methyltransferase domain-containing protein [Planctomycetota bacterium]